MAAKRGASTKLESTPAPAPALSSISEFPSGGGAVNSAANPADFRNRLEKEFSRFDFAIGPDRQILVWEPNDGGGGRFIEAIDDWLWTTSKKFISQNMSGWITDATIRWLNGTLRTGRPRLDFRPPSGLVNCLSGIVAPRTGKVRPATPAEWPSMVQIPIRYDPLATCEPIKRFLAEVFPADALDFIWEFIGSLLVPDIFSQHIVWLTGPGGNGKGTFLKLLVRFLGPSNSFPMPIRSLAGNRFALADIAGKLLIYEADTPMSEIRQSEVLKQVSGHDPVRAERKGRDSFLFEPFAKLIFGANDDPSAADLSHGMLRRWLLIPCDNRISGSVGERRDQDQFIFEMLANGGAEGMLAHAVAGLGRLMARGRFEIPPSIVEKTAAYRAGSNPLAEFFLERLRLDPAAEIPLADLRQALESWSQAHGYKMRPNREILHWLTGAHPAVEIRRANRAAGTGAVLLGGLGWQP